MFAPAQFGSEAFSTIYTGRPQQCSFVIGNIATFRNMEFRVLYTDLPGNCSQARINVFRGIGTGERLLTTICSPEDAKQSVKVDDFLMTVEYHVNIPGLRGFRATVVDKCEPGFMPARTGNKCERKYHFNSLKQLTLTDQCCILSISTYRHDNTTELIKRIK